jgi:excisionase family DNA binding protein
MERCDEGDREDANTSQRAGRGPARCGMDSKTFYKDDGDDGEPIGLRPAEAAARLGISVTTLYRLRIAGRIPFVKLDGAVLFRVASLDQFLLEHEQRTTQDTA